MEETIKIESFRYYSEVTAEQRCALLNDLIESNRKELLLIPDPYDPDRYDAVVVAEYYTPELSELIGTREKRCLNGLQYIFVARMALRSFISGLLRKMHVSSSAKFDPYTFSQQAMAKENKAPTSGEGQSAVQKKDETVGALQFLRSKAPALIEKELNELVIGQPELTKAVADFLYYHALRQIHPELPQRPLLISGPSGSGKTEVWRAASRLYGDTFSIKIIDGSSLSCEGWSGNYKLDTYVDSEMANGILVVDEFDKLAKPRHNSKGDNVSLDMQSEFLKLMEGEYHIVKDRKQTGKTSQQMGFVLVGAFENLRNEVESRRCAAKRIGFNTDASTPRTSLVPSAVRFTDEDFIHYGIIPEIVGRIATKCSTLPLDENAYMDIIYSPHSRVSQIQNTLRRYGAVSSDLISDEELHTLISTSRSNKTGVRWVSAQVENRLLNAIREQGIFFSQADAA